MSELQAKLPGMRAALLAHLAALELDLAALQEAAQGAELGRLSRDPSLAEGIEIELQRVEFERRLTQKVLDALEELEANLPTRREEEA